MALKIVQQKITEATLFQQVGRVYSNYFECLQSFLDSLSMRVKQLILMYITVQPDRSVTGGAIVMVKFRFGLEIDG